MQHSSASPSHSALDIKKKFTIKPALNEHTQRYSYAHKIVERPNQVSSKQPPVSAIASSRPETRQAISEHKELRHGQSSHLAVVAPIQRSTIQRTRPLDFVAGVFAKSSLQSIRAPQQHNHISGLPCPACRALEIEAMTDFTELPFAEAFPLWFEAHKPYISPRTIHDYEQYGNALMAFFGPLQLKNIGIGQIRGFQMWRSKTHINESSGGLESKYQHSASSVRIRNEINAVLKPVLREAGVWAGIKERKFKHLPVPSEGSGIALSKEQWAQIFAIAFEERRWTLAGHCLQIMFRNGFGFGELRKVKRRDAIAEEGKLRIDEGAKNESRKRTVVLSPSALDSLKWLIARWEKLGGSSPDQYLLPHKATIANKTLNRPMVSINFAWNAIKREWAVRQPKQARSETRQYDARVSAATLLLKNKNLSLSTIEKALGWTPSSAMRKRYYRADQDAVLEALRTLEDAQ
jgi:integrase